MHLSYHRISALLINRVYDSLEQMLWRVHGYTHLQRQRASVPVSCSVLFRGRSVQCRAAIRRGDRAEAIRLSRSTIIVMRIGLSLTAIILGVILLIVRLMYPSDTDDTTGYSP